MFSQSLQLGDSTFDALERQLTKAHTSPITPRIPTTASQRSITIRQQQQSSTESEVIEESPTNAKCPAELSRQRSVRERLQIISTQARGRKTKSRTARSANDAGQRRSSASEHSSNHKTDNFSKLFSSDIQFDSDQSTQANTLKRTRGSQQVGSNDDGPSPEKQSFTHQNEQLDELFQNSAFSMDTVRSQSIAITAAQKEGSSFHTLFDQSDFTLEQPDGMPEPVENQPIPAIMTESELEMFSETLFDRAILSEPAMNDLLGDSDLIESLRVDSADDTVEDVAIDIENITFSQPLAPASIVLGQQETSDRSIRRELRERDTEMYNFIESEMEYSLRLSKEASFLSDTVANGYDESGPFPGPSGRKNVSKERTKTAQDKQTLTGSMSLDSTTDLRLLVNWGLPSSVASGYAKKGIVELFAWQVECLSRKEVVLEGKNLIYSAPTSAGKTLVSEFLLIKTIAERKLKAMLILPFVAVAREKMLYLKDLLEPCGIRVEGFYGGYHPPGGFESVDLAVCTIEKANSIVNRLLEQSSLTTLGVVVVDEAHLISDPSRGYILELLLTKIRFVAARADHRIQIVCMSATLPNMDLLARWLEADLYRTDFRPIALIETIKIGNTIYSAAGESIRSLDGITLLGYSIPKDADHVVLLCLETILEGCAVIVFCPSKDWCEQLAISLASTLHTLRNRGDHSNEELRNRLCAQVDGVRQEEVVLQLRNSPAGLDSVLEKTVPYGVAFHHAGLTTDERDIVEGSFREGALRIIVATSTLSSGVNLPARRVIIRTPKFGGRPMSALTYKQMIGRAGRTGRDTLGESILICSATEERIGRELIGTELPPVRSCLDSENYSHLTRAVLEIIASGSATTSDDLESFVNATLYSCERGHRFIVNDHLLRTKSPKPKQLPVGGDDDGKANEDMDPIVACISFLLEYEFIRLLQQEDPDRPGERTVLSATRLGNACLAASLPPKDGFLLFSELQRARQCFVLESELHAIYLVTPYSVAYQWQQIDWMDFLDLWEKLPAASKRVGELVGVKESFMVRAMRGGAAHLDYRSLQIHKRFYTALALLELVREVPLGTVARQFKCCRGLLQSLQQVSATFAGIVTSFCASLNWTLLQLLVAQFRERLFFGVAHELLDLMRISSLNGQRARLLYDGGIVGLVQLANADRLTVETILHNRASFEMERLRENEHAYEAERRKRVRNLYLTGRSGVTVQEAARLLIQEARTFVQLEHGLANPSWSQLTVGQVEEAKEKEEPEQRTQPPSGSTVGRSEDQTSSLSLLSAGGESSSTTERHFHNSLLMRNDRVTTTDGDEDDHTMAHLTIIDVCNDQTVYDQFRQTVAEQSSLTIAFGVEQEKVHCPDGRVPLAAIGAHLQSRERVPNTCDRSYTFDDHLYLAGIGLAVKDTSSTVYYVDLQTETVVDGAEKVRFVHALFSRNQLTITLLDAKEQLKIAYRSKLLPVAEGDQLMDATLQDPRVACWLLQTDAETLTLDAMINRHCPTLKKRIEQAWTRQQHWITPKWTGYAMNHHSPIDARQRCAVECLVVRELMCYVGERLAASGDSLPVCFTSREMPVQVALARAEVIGFPVDRERLEALIIRLKACRDRIADEARKYNGNRRLDFGSSRAVAKALQLANGPDQKRCRTVRQVLERLNSPLAALVIAHRKIESNLSRTIEPLYRIIRAGSDRVHGRSFCFTSTGRITMHEPNLQTVVKDFTVPPDLGHEFEGEWRLFSCRSTFACADPDRTVLLSADFCQLELCILTHLSQDRKLMETLGADGERGGQTACKDVFRALAARWNQLERESDVSEELRNRTKTIVYGVIYGMGVRAMAAELHLDEDAARTLMEQFHATYPEIRRYIERVVRLTRQLGYIETLTGRRRYLPAITSANARERAEAERQAVCTTIQGSAADILKNAIVRMGRNLGKYRNVLELNEIRLVLHMHDELIYEVPRNQLDKVAKLLKSSMENCAKLSVPLRVKLKAGPSWGTLQELTTLGKCS